MSYEYNWTDCNSFQLQIVYKLFTNCLFSKVGCHTPPFFSSCPVLLAYHSLHTIACPNSPHLHQAVREQFGLEEGEEAVQDVLPALSKDVVMAMGQGEDQVEDVTDLGTLT